MVGAHMDLSWASLMECEGWIIVSDKRGRKRRRREEDTFFMATVEEEGEEEDKCYLTMYNTDIYIHTHILRALLTWRVSV